jgi:glucose/mannose-6-phosphate isomerase
VTVLDEGLLDSVDRLAAADPAEMMRLVATSGAQVRSGWRAAAEAGIDRLVGQDRPRAVLVAGVGGSGITGDLLAAVAGTGCPVPIVTCRSYALPGWVGSTDLVIAVSCSGRTEETLQLTEEAGRRGCQLVVVAPPESPLGYLAAQQRGLVIGVDAAGAQPRTMLWALSLPVLAVARAVGILEVTDAEVEAAGARLEEVATRCRPGSESFLNPAKSLAVDLAGSLPMVWGSSPVAGVAAYRMCCQLAENAKYPSLSGTLPEPNHNQVVAFDGVFAAGGAGGSPGGAGGTASDDFFADRVKTAADIRLHLVSLRDLADEHPQIARRAEVSRDLARERGLVCTELAAEGESRLERLASLVGLLDFASVYLALGLGIDPTPVAPIAELKARIAG